VAGAQSSAERGVLGPLARGCQSGRYTRTRRTIERFLWALCCVRIPGVGEGAQAAASSLTTLTAGRVLDALCPATRAHAKRSLAPSPGATARPFDAPRWCRPRSDDYVHDSWKCRVGHITASRSRGQTTWPGAGFGIHSSCPEGPRTTERLGRFSDRPNDAGSRFLWAFSCRHSVTLRPAGSNNASAGRLIRSDIEPLGLARALTALFEGSRSSVHSARRSTPEPTCAQDGRCSSTVWSHARSSKALPASAWCRLSILRPYFR